MNTNLNDSIDAKIQEIVQALGEPWKIAKPRLLLHSEGYGLEIATDYSRLKMKDRLIFAGHYAYERDDLTSYTSERLRDSLPTITVSLSREAEAIANEIRLRLLPRYLEQRARLIECRSNYQEQRWREQRIAVNLRNALGARDAQLSDSKVWRDYPRRADRRAIAVEATAECWHSDAPAMVRVSISGLSPEEAEEVLTWTQKINPPLEDETP